MSEANTGNLAIWLESFTTSREIYCFTPVICFVIRLSFVNSLLPLLLCCFYYNTSAFTKLSSLLIGSSSWVIQKHVRVCSSHSIQLTVGWMEWDEKTRTCFWVTQLDHPLHRLAAGRPLALGSVSNVLRISCILPKTRPAARACLFI